MLTFVLDTFAPVMPSPGLDGSWVVVTGEASARPARWGVDLAFTYGPAAPLVTSYYSPDYFSHVLPLLILLATCQGLCIACLLFSPDGSNAPLRPTGLGLVVALFWLSFGHVTRDFVYMSLALGVFLLAFDRLRSDVVTPPGREPGARDPFGLLALMLATLGLGVIGVSKTSFLVLALALLGLLDLVRLTRRRLPWQCLVGLLGFLATYLSFHQTLGDLPVYLSRQFAVAAGYGEAMATYGDPAELRMFACLAVAMILAAGLAEALQRTTSRRARITDAAVLVAGVLLFVLTLLKAGFVRFDDGHTAIAFTSLALGATFLMALLPRRAPLATLTLSTVAVWAGVVAILGAVPPLRKQEPKLARLERFYKEQVRPALRHDIVAVSSALLDPAGWRAWLDQAKAEAFEQVRRERGLPPLPGTVDVIQSEQSALLASGIDYHPRPSFQEYSTYTASLIAADRAFFEGSSAPDRIIFAPGSIDGRDPASAEGASWPDFLRLYTPERWVADALVLRRRDRPLPDLAGPVTHRTIRLGESLPVDLEGLVVASIRVDHTLFGSLANAFYRPPLLWLTLDLADHTHKTFRFVPAQGEGGFVLSPLIADPIDFAEAAIGRVADLSAHRVVALRIDGGSAATWFYRGEVGIDLAGLDSEPLRRMAGRPLAAILDPRPMWHDLLRAAADPAAPDPAEATRLPVTAPNALTLPVVGFQHIGFGFGIPEADWSRDGSPAMCFALEARPPAAAPLWQKCLDPLADPAERGTFGAEVALPPETKAVVLTTSCPGPCSRPEAYWSDLTVR